MGADRAAPPPSTLPAESATPLGVIYPSSFERKARSSNAVFQLAVILIFLLPVAEVVLFLLAELVVSDSGNAAVSASRNAVVSAR